MTNTKVYYVRSLALQREILGADGSKSLQAYKPGSKVELSEAEAIKYQHLVESEDSYKSRQPKSSKKETK